MVHRGTIIACAAALALAGCYDSNSDSDAGITIMVDSGGGGGSDGGGVPTFDSSVPPGVDGGGTMTSDGGTAPTDDAAIPTRPGAVGAACASDADCTEPMGATCQTVVGSGRFSYEFPGGYCSGMCTAGSGSSECGTGADCFSVGFGGFGIAFCAKVCRSDSDCRTDDGYTCQAPPFGGGTTRYCLPPRPTGGDGGFSFGDGGFSLPDGGFSLPDAAF